MNEELTGWMALLEIDGNACQDLQQALQAASALGWTLTEEEAVDANAGLWMVTLTPDDFRELAAQHGLSHRVNIAGHVYYGEIDTP